MIDEEETEIDLERGTIGIGIETGGITTEGIDATMSESGRGGTAIVRTVGTGIGRERGVTIGIIGDEMIGVGIDMPGAVRKGWDDVVVLHLRG